MVINRIQVITICIFRRDESIFVVEYFDATDNKPFYRPPGGRVEFGETTEKAVRREIREECRQEITDLRLLKILESIFTHEGKPHHEIVYLYEGYFAEDAMYEQDSFEIQEDTGEVFKASWRELSFFNDYHRLVPEELVNLLKTRK